jgi:hypothetical protein
VVNCCVHSDADSLFGDLYAQQAVSVYAVLYAIERKVRAEKVNHQQRYVLRQKHAKFLLEKIKQWLDKNSLLVPL